VVNHHYRRLEPNSAPMQAVTSAGVMAFLTGMIRAIDASWKAPGGIGEARDRESNQ